MMQSKWNTLRVNDSLCYVLLLKLGYIESACSDDPKDHLFVMLPWHTMS